MVKDGSIYVGEFSRSIFERSREHWSDYRSNSDKSHILKHHQIAHGGVGEPCFIMRTVSFYRTALARQVGEAVRIRRRGGAGSILNSKSEYDRCRIPRLVIEQEDEEEIKKTLEEELQSDKTRIEEQASSWGALQYIARKEEDIKAEEEEEEEG